MHCCVCAVVGHHVGGPQYCAIHAPIRVVTIPLPIWPHVGAASEFVFPYRPVPTGAQSGYFQTVVM